MVERGILWPFGLKQPNNSVVLLTKAKSVHQGYR